MLQVRCVVCSLYRDSLLISRRIITIDGGPGPGGQFSESLGGYFWTIASLPQPENPDGRIGSAIPPSKREYRQGSLFSPIISVYPVPDGEGIPKITQ